MHYLLVSITLYLFWVVLSGHFTPLLLTLGIISTLLVVWLLRRMDRVDGTSVGANPGLALGLPGYGVWLLGNLIKSNIDVARRIWDPALPVNPSWTRLPVQVSTPLKKTLYANSITLTPGTLTADVHEDHFLVHSLSDRGISLLRSGEMERRIHRLDPGD